MKFPYQKFPSGTPVFYPILSLTLINPKTKKAFPNYLVLVDSGASSCVFHAGIAEEIGINIESGQKAPLRGVIGEAGQQFFHSVSLVIAGHEFKSKVGFSDDLKMPFGLLGQVGFFDQFRVCFDFPKKEFEITPKSR